jgi:hypothetical protein
VFTVDAETVTGRPAVRNEELAEARRRRGPPADPRPRRARVQFDLDTDAGQLFLERLVAFLRQRLGPPTHA